MGEVTENEVPSDEQTPKKGRHRKKQLYNSILQQMEFYFSDSNLSKDRLLNQLLQEHSYVDINVFLKFNKIRKLTNSVEDIQKAIKNSALIELSEDKSSVCRRIPIKKKTNVDDCTIYVERIKSDATHEWINSVFSEFGNVVYVSIPKYKNNNAVKGFAFVEFDNEKEAQNALSYFESIGCKMSSNVQPEDLCSIVTFDSNVEKETELESTSKKRKFEEIEEDNSEKDEKEKHLKLEPEESSEANDTEQKKKKKQKKEHKKKNYIKELGLQVLSKNEWRKMRNRYLNMQKMKMKEFKKHLYRAKFSQTNYEDKFKKPAENGDQNKLEEIVEETSSKIEFVEGVIVKTKMEEPSLDIKKFKNEIKSTANGVKYVDVQSPGSDIVYIRFNNNNNAKQYCGQDSSNKKSILEGEEEKAYWDKIFKSRENKVKKEHKKCRGRNKLLKKANQVMAKHVKFDD